MNDPLEMDPLDKVRAQLMEIEMRLADQDEDIEQWEFEIGEEA